MVPAGQEIAVKAARTGRLAVCPGTPLACGGSDCFYLQLVA